MITKLRRRLTLLVIGALALVTVGIVLSIHVIDLRNIDHTAAAALRVLSENQGRRPALDQPTPPEGDRLPEDSPPPKPEGDRPEAEGETPPPKPTGEATDETPPPKPEGDPAFQGRPGIDMRGGDSLASLSNAYTVHLDADGSVTTWSSDRSDLYDDDEVRAMAAAAIAAGRDSGRIGTQYYRLTDDDSVEGGRLLVVLDARLEFLSAERTLRATVLVAALAGLLLAAGAYLLICRMLRPVQASFDRQKQFVWDASHEFKTPLAVISANAELLSRQVGPNEYLGYIQSEVKRTDNLVQGLLTLARMDKGTVTAEMKRFNLSDALLSVALPFESTVFEAGAPWRRTCPRAYRSRATRGCSSSWRSSC